MRAREKLDEAAYFLGMLKQAKGTAYHYILSAFIVAWRSVVDVMLFDFVEKYSLGFRPEDRVDDRMFEAVARALKRNEALRFLSWWRGQDVMKRLRKHPLYRRRDMIVHRGEPPATYVIPLPEVLRDFAGDLGQFDLFIIEDESKKETKLMVAQGRLTDSEAKKMHEEIEEHGAVVDGGELQYEFLDFPGRDIGEVCTEAFEYMKGVVEKAERDFWASL